MHDVISILRLSVELVKPKVIWAIYIGVNSPDWGLNWRKVL